MSNAIELLGGDPWVIVEGEMLTGLRSMPTGSVDALITDAPYSSGGAYRGDRMNDTTAKYVSNGVQIDRPDFAGDNRDQRSFAYWCALWLAECLRIAKPGAICCLFTDWRQLPSTTDAMQAGGWVWRGIIPWNKTEATRPQMGRPRAQAEYVVFGSAGALPPRVDVGVQPGWLDVDQVRENLDHLADQLTPDEIGSITAGVNLAEKVHIAGKPTAVMQQLARLCVPGGIVLDPFCGSASTGVGALREGRRFVGMEIAEVWAKISRERLKAEVLGVTLKDHRDGQTSLFAPGVVEQKVAQLMPIEAMPPINGDE